jgi:hypothetical protein
MTGQLTSYVDIDAAPERVWQVLMDLPAYPEWNPFVTRAEGEFAVGARVVFTGPPAGALLRVRFPATVLELVPDRRLAFRVRLMKLGLPGLLDVQQTMTLDPRDDGRVRLWEEARFSGALVPLLTRSLNREHTPSFLAMNAAFKERVERVPRT